MFNFDNASKIFAEKYHAAEYGDEINAAHGGYLHFHFQLWYLW